MPKTMLHLIKTSNILLDDRMLKEIRIISRNSLNNKVISLNEDNQRKKLVLENGVQAWCLSLLSRRFFPRRKAIFLKAIELNIYYTFYCFKMRPEFAWIHEFNIILVIVLGLLRKVRLIRTCFVWDLHEMPPKFFLENRIGRIFTRFACKFSSVVVFPNRPRLDFFLDKIGQESSEKFHVLENFPSRELLDLTTTQIPAEVSKFLKGRRYFVLQGVTSKDRMLIESFEAVLRTGEHCLVVAGPIRNELQNLLESHFSSEDLDRRLFITGFVSLKETIEILDHSIASLIFYRNSNINNFFCAPNRLYHALIRGVPVVCGNNPTMVDAVRDGRSCVVVDTDGADIEKIAYGIRSILEKGSSELRQAMESLSRYTFEAQCSKMQNILARLKLDENKCDY